MSHEKKINQIEMQINALNAEKMKLEEEIEIELSKNLPQGIFSAYPMILKIYGKSCELHFTPKGIDHVLKTLKRSYQYHCCIPIGDELKIQIDDNDGEIYFDCVERLVSFIKKYDVKINFSHEEKRIKEQIKDLEEHKEQIKVLKEICSK